MALRLAKLGCLALVLSAGGAAAHAACFPMWDAFIGTPGIAPDVPPTYPPAVNTIILGNLGSGDRIYAGGAFDFAGGIAAKNVARWNGAAWSAMAAGRPGSVSALAWLTTSIYAAGSFGDGQDISRWDGSAWQSVGGGVNGSVNALTTFNDGGGTALFVGGTFTRVGSTLITASRIAKWNGTTWSALTGGPAAGLNGTCTSLYGAAASTGVGNFLYIGGSFTTAGGTSALRIAKWSGSAWSAMGSGFNAPVLTMTAFNDGTGAALYVGGSFTEDGTGTQSFLHIAKWSPATSQWSAVGAGLDDTVLSLTVLDDGNGPALYAGGEFLHSGGTSLNHIARWKNGAWEPVPAGTNDDVFSVVGVPNTSTLGPALYAGGLFGLAGGVESLRVGKWSACVAAVDCNSNGIPDSDELAGNDCNSNGTLDACELTGNDCNSNSILDACETDCNTNGVPDDCDIAAGANDFNTNGIPDSCEPDCNSNGVPDFVDVLFVSDDCNTNGVPDECEVGNGDIDGDGDVDLADYARVAACLNGPHCESAPCNPVTYTGFCCSLVDSDSDGDVDLKDVRKWVTRY